MERQRDEGDRRILLGDNAAAHQFSRTWKSGFQLVSLLHKYCASPIRKCDSRQIYLHRNFLNVNYCASRVSVGEQYYAYKRRSAPSNMVTLHTHYSRLQGLTRSWVRANACVLFCQATRCGRIGALLYSANKATVTTDSATVSHQRACIV